MQSQNLDYIYYGVETAATAALGLLPPEGKSVMQAKKPLH